jgi:hypothetical protein
MAGAAAIGWRNVSWLEDRLAVGPQRGAVRQLALGEAPS